MKNNFLLLITIILIFTAAACNSPDGNSTSSGGADSSRAAVVDDFLGEVTAVSDGENMPAFKGLALLRQDSLGTGTESWSSLELSENRFVLVEENSDVLISQLADDAKNAEVTLSAGKIWVIITDKLADDEGFQVVTPTCSLSVRGTVFAVSCDKEGGSRAAVYEGTIQFTAEGETGETVTFDVTRGAAEVVVEDGAVIEVRQSDLTYEDLAVLRVGGPGGPGGVYEILRERLPELESDNYELITVRGTIIYNFDIYSRQFNEYIDQYGSNNVGIRSYGVRFSAPLVMSSGETINEAALTYDRQEEEEIFGAWFERIDDNNEIRINKEQLFNKEMSMTGYFEFDSDYAEFIAVTDNRYTVPYFYDPNGPWVFHVISTSN